MYSSDIVIWNARSVRSRTAFARIELLTLTTSAKPPAVIILCETHLDPSITISFPNYSLHRLDHTHNSSGVCILTHRNIPSTPLTTHAISIPFARTAALFLPVRIALPRKTDKPLLLILLSAYIPPNPPADASQRIVTSLSNLLANQHLRDTPVVIAGDLNCRDAAIACGPGQSPDPTLFSRAATHPIVRLLQSSNLSSLNSSLASSIPTRVAQGVSSCLDAALTTHPHLFATLEVGAPKELTASDHLPLTLSCRDAQQAEPSRYMKLPNFTALPQPKLLRFKQLTDLAKWEGLTDVDRIWHALKDSMQQALTSISRPSSTKPAQDYLPANELALFREAKRARNRRRSFARKLKEQPQIGNGDSHLRMLKDLATVKRKVFLAALKALRTARYTEKVNAAFEDQQNRVFPNWEALRRIMGKPSAPAALISGPSCPNPSSHQDSANNFADYVESIVNKVPTKPTADYVLPQSSPIVAVTDEEFAEALKRLPNKKAPGQDGINGAAIKNASARWLHGLRYLTDCSLREAQIPALWKNSKAFVLHKSGLTADPSNHRMITLEAVALKFVERIVLNRIQSTAQRYLNPNQYGFRRGRSTHDAIAKLAAASNKARRSELPYPVVFLDLKAAFDTVGHFFLFTALSNPRYGVHPQLVRWCVDFCSNRTFTAWVGTACSSPRAIRNGVPQGSVISPFLFLLFIDSLYHDLIAAQPTPAAQLLPEIPSTAALLPPPVPCDLIAFADDLGVAPTREGLLAYADLRHTLEVISRWGVTTGMTWGRGVKKSAALHFSPHENRHRSMANTALAAKLRQLPLLLDGVPLHVTESYKYLGVVMSSDFSSVPHFQHVLPQLQAAAASITTLCRNNSPAPVDLMVTLSQTFLCSIFSYSAPFVSYTRKQLTAMSALLIAPFRRALRLPFNTHRSSLFCESGLLPADILQIKARDNALRRWHHLLTKDSANPAPRAFLSELKHCVVAREFRAPIGPWARQRSDALIPIPTSPPDPLYYSTLLRQRLFGADGPINAHLSTRQKGWGAPLRAVLTSVYLPPLDPSTAQTIRFFHTPAHLATPPDTATTIARARLDLWSDWRKAKTANTEPPLCSRCTLRTPSTALHALTQCTHSTHIREDILATATSGAVRRAVLSLGSSYDALTRGEKQETATLIRALIRRITPNARK